MAWGWLLALAAGLVLVSLVLAVLQRLVKLALGLLLVAALAAGAWVLLRDAAPPEVRQRVDRATAQGARIAGQAAAVGAELVSEARRGPRGDVDSDAPGVEAAGPAAAGEGS